MLIWHFPMIGADTGTFTATSTISTTNLEENFQLPSIDAILASSNHSKIIPKCFVTASSLCNMIVTEDISKKVK